MNVRLPKQFTLDRLFRNTLDYFTRVGEPVLVVSIQKPTNNRGVRCTRCYDTTYSQVTDINCPVCFGTGYRGGYNALFKTYATMTSQSSREDRTSRGEWNPERRNISIPAVIQLSQRDLVIRVSSWYEDGTPADVNGVFSVGPVTKSSIRDGQISTSINEENMTLDFVADRIHDENPWATEFVRRLREHDIPENAITFLDTLPRMLGRGPVGEIQRVDMPEPPRRTFEPKSPRPTTNIPWEGEASKDPDGGGWV